MAEETDTFAIKPGTLPRTDFKDEQDRLEVYSSVMRVASQLGIAVKGERGVKGEQGPAGVTNISVENVPIPSGALLIDVPSGNVENAIVMLKKEGLSSAQVAIGPINGARVTFLFATGIASVPDATYSLIVKRFVNAVISAPTP